MLVSEIFRKKQSSFNRFLVKAFYCVDSNPKASKPQKPWFDAGLKFSCTGCGKCCSGPAGNVWITNTDVLNISKKLDMDPTKFLKKYARWVPRAKRWTLIEKSRGENLDCIFLENGKTCAIYDVRPTQCKTYPYWPGVLQSEESWEAEKLDCEGIGLSTAPLTPASSILDTLEIQRKDTILTYDMGKKPDWKDK